MIRRCECLERPTLVLEPRRPGSRAAAGWDGGVLRVPKSLGVDTIGSPKWCIQTPVDDDPAGERVLGAP